jgi:hypothetical protein
LYTKLAAGEIVANAVADKFLAKAEQTVWVWPLEINLVGSMEPMPASRLATNESLNTSTSNVLPFLVM